MGANISFNPYATSNAAGSFNTTSEGHIQGVFLDDPAVRYTLAGGTYLGSSQPTMPMIGGAAVTEGIRDGVAGLGTLPAAGNASLGNIIDYASTVTAASGANASLGQITGFSVLNQMYNGVSTPQSPAPTFGAGNGVGYFRLGSGARIVVAMDPSLVSASGYLITSYFGWNWNGQFLQAYDAATPTINVTSMTYATTNGGQIAVVAAAPTNIAAVGDLVNISGATTTGTGGNSAVNGTFVVNTFTDNQHFTVSATNAGGAAYYGTISTGSAVINQGTGALPVKVLSFDIGNSMTYQWDPVNSVATWNRNGSTAVILI